MTSHNNTSWYTDTDGFLEHSPRRGSLYYKAPTLQKIIPVFLGVPRGTNSRGTDTSQAIMIQGVGCCDGGDSGCSEMPYERMSGKGKHTLIPTKGKTALPPSCPSPSAIPDVGNKQNRAGYISAMCSKARAPNAKPTVSRITESWHGLNQFPWKSMPCLAVKGALEFWVYPSVSFKH